MEIAFNLLTYFFIYSFLGWVIESAYKSIMNKKVINSGFLFGPFCPIYGFGAIIMYLFLEDVSNKPIVTFCLGFVVLSIWEYSVGVFLEKVFHTKYWDYSNYKFNLQGRVCLMNSVFWGILGVLFIDIIHPFIQGLLDKVNYDIILYIDAVVFVVVLVDTIASVRNTFNMAERLKRVEELNNSIKEKLDEIKEKGKAKGGAALQDALDELNLRRESIAQKAYKSVTRLKRAFPTLKSEQITNFLSEKTDMFKSNKQ